MYSTQNFHLYLTVIVTKLDFNTNEEESDLTKLLALRKMKTNDISIDPALMDPPSVPTSSSAASPLTPAPASMVTPQVPVPPLALAPVVEI